MIEDIDNNEGFKQLYDNFVERMRQGSEDMFYDLDELLDIFDYANESLDSYVCNAVLRLGSRLYPDNDALRVRQGIALIQHIDTDGDGFARFMEDNADRKSLMWDILRLYLLATAPVDERRKALDETVGNARFVEDEEVVQFVNAVEYINCSDWLIENIATIRSKCEYEPTLLFDVAEIARRSGNLELSVSLLEELTMIEPFSIDFWVSLAKSYDEAGRIEEGTTAIDYARTLEPDNMQAKLYAFERAEENNLESPGQLTVRLEELSASNPENMLLKQMLADKYAKAGRRDAAVRLRHEIFTACPGQPQPLAELLRVDPGNAATYLTVFKEAVDDGFRYADGVADTEQVLCHVIGEFAHSDITVADALYRTFVEHGMPGESARQYYLHMYLAGHDKDALDTFAGIAALKQYQLPYEVFPIIAAMFLRCGLNDTALTCCGQFDKLLDELTPYSLDSYLSMTGARTLLDRIRSYAESTDDTPDDPLGLKPLT